MAAWPLVPRSRTLERPTLAPRVRPNLFNHTAYVTQMYILLMQHADSRSVVYQVAELEIQNFAALCGTDNCRQGPRRKSQQNHRDAFLKTLPTESYRP